MPKSKKTKTMSTKAMKKTKGGLVAATKGLAAQEPMTATIEDTGMAQSYDASLEVLRKR